MDLTPNEHDYLTGQRLGRLATLAPDGSPQTRPVGFFVNDELGTIDIGGHNITTSQKYRNVQRDPRVSFVVDDLATIEPWAPRGIEIRGTAEAIPDVRLYGPGSTPGVIRIRPTRVLGWGLDTNAFAPPHARDVDAADPS